MGTHFLCVCARLVVCACACRSVFIIDHGRVEATEKEADERRKRREDVRRHSKGESGARRRDECTRHGEGFWKRRRRKDPRRRLEEAQRVLPRWSVVAMKKSRKRK